MVQGRKNMSFKSSLKKTYIERNCSINNSYKRILGMRLNTLISSCDKNAGIFCMAQL